LKEIPDGKATTNIDKNKFISKLSSLPSVRSISSDEMRNIISSVDPTLASEPSRQKYPELSNAKLEDTLKETIGHLRKQGLKNNKAPAKIQFAEVYLKSVPELVDSSSLSDTELLVNLSDMYERVPKDGRNKRKVRFD
jgi:transcriptional regulator NrdR family protein